MPAESCPLHESRYFDRATALPRLVDLQSRSEYSPLFESAEWTPVLVASCPSLVGMSFGLALYAHEAETSECPTTGCFTFTAISFSHDDREVVQGGVASSISLGSESFTRKIYVNYDTRGFSPYQCFCPAPMQNDTVDITTLPAVANLDGYPGAAEAFDFRATLGAPDLLGVVDLTAEPFASDIAVRMSRASGLPLRVDVQTIPVGDGHNAYGKSEFVVWPRVDIGTLNGPSGRIDLPSL